MEIDDATLARCIAAQKEWETTQDILRTLADPHWRSDLT